MCGKFRPNHFEAVADVVDRFIKIIGPNKIYFGEKDMQQLKIIEEFLPKQIGEEETKKICEDIVKKLNVSSIKEMGKVMGELKKTHADTLDFSKVGSILREIIK